MVVHVPSGGARHMWLSCSRRILSFWNGKSIGSSEQFVYSLFICYDNLLPRGMTMHFQFDEGCVEYAELEMSDLNINAASP